MAKSDIEDTLESPGNCNDSTMIPDANNKLLGENHTIIHSGHFMVSCIDDEDNELAGSKEKEGFDFQSAVQEPAPTYQFIDKTTDVVGIDGSLTKLFECMTLAYSGKLTSPKWKNFKGIKLSLKDKIRLNNIIWREWHMQYIQGLLPIICQFDPPIADKTHTKAEAVVLEGKYWKRRLESVTAEYMKWRMFHKERLTPYSISNQLLSTAAQGETCSNFPDLGQSSLDQLMSEDIGDIMDLTDTLLSSINNPQPFPFPSPREMNAAQLNNAALIQPFLIQLQPNIEEVMDTLEPLPSLQEMMASSANYRSNSHSMMANSDSSNLLPNNNLMSGSEENNTMLSSGLPTFPGLDSQPRIQPLQQKTHQNTQKVLNELNSYSPLMQPIRQQQRPCDMIKENRLENSTRYKTTAVTKSLPSQMTDNTISVSRIPQSPTPIIAYTKTPILFNHSSNVKTARSSGISVSTVASLPTAPISSISSLMLQPSNVSLAQHVQSVIPMQADNSKPQFINLVLDNQQAAEVQREPPKYVKPCGPPSLSEPTQVPIQSTPQHPHMSTRVQQPMSSSTQAPVLHQLLGASQVKLERDTSNQQQVSHSPMTIFTKNTPVVQQDMQETKNVTLVGSFTSPSPGGNVTLVTNSYASQIQALLGLVQQQQQQKEQQKQKNVQQQVSQMIQPSNIEILPTTLAQVPAVRQQVTSHHAQMTSVSSDGNIILLRNQKRATQPEDVPEDRQKKTILSQDIRRASTGSMFGKSRNPKANDFIVPKIVNIPRNTNRTRNLSGNDCPLTGALRTGSPPISVQQIQQTFPQSSTLATLLKGGQSLKKEKTSNTNVANAFQPIQPAPSICSPLFTVPPSSFSRVSMPSLTEISSRSAVSPATAASPLGMTQLDQSPNSPLASSIRSAGSNPSSPYQVPSPLTSEESRSRHPSNESVGLDNEEYGSRGRNPHDPEQYQVQRRASHITAEHKRRCNIKTAFETLQQLVPALRRNPSNKISKAAILQKSAGYCHKLKQERVEMQKESEQLKQEIESLNSAISSCQSQLPADGVPVTRQRVDRMKQMFDNYIRTRTLENWKFWIFSLIMQSLFDSYNSMVSTASIKDMCRTVKAWLQQHCTLIQLRPAMLNSLRQLSTSTSILSDPGWVPEQARQAVTQRLSSTPGHS